MGKPILLLRLEGPLQSWGSRSRWDVRDTASEPTKSGIIGLLGCALGYPIQDARLEVLDAALRFGVRIEHPGRMLIDYQTITDFLPSADGRFKHSGAAMGVSIDKLRRDPSAQATTIQSPRTYIEDGAFLVALEATDHCEQLLEACVSGIQQPRWPLFLGRKACIPTRPIFESFTDTYENVEDALQRHPWSWLGRAHSLADRTVPMRDLNGFVEVSPKNRGRDTYTRQDAIRTNNARAYGFCTLRSFAVNLFQADEQSEAEMP